MRDARGANPPTHHMLRSTLARVINPSCSTGVVNIYDAVTLRRRKMLTFPDLGGKGILSVGFSHDAKLCLVQGGAPDYTCVLFGIEKAVKVRRD